MVPKTTDRKWHMGIVSSNAHVIDDINDPKDRTRALNWSGLRFLAPKYDD